MPNAIVDCSKIPQKTYHGKECYDWLNSQNALIPFRYNDLIGILEIVSVEKKGHGYNLTVNYEGRLSQIDSSSLISGHLGNCIGMESLNENAERVRLHRAKESVCKPVHIIAPNGEEYDFLSLTEACKELEVICEIQLPISSVSISIAQNRPFKNFLFRYINTPK